MSRLAKLAALSVALAFLLVPRMGQAWIENRVESDEVRIELAPSGKAVVEHRLTVKLNGNERQRAYVLRGVDADAVPLENSYVIPAREDLSSSLDAAIPVKQAVERPTRHGVEQPPELVAQIDHHQGLWRGSYLFVLRYATDLRTAGAIRRDGAMVRVDWRGPLLDDGIDNARVTFVLPPAPTAPRAVEDPVAGDPDAEGGAATYLSEVRRGTEHDEVELLRSFAPQQTAVPWAVRVDQRALVPLPRPALAPPPPTPLPLATALGPVLFGRRIPLLGIAGGLSVLFALLVALKSRQVRRRAAEARATVPPAVPLPTWVRAPAAGAALFVGLAFQLGLAKPLGGAIAVVAAALLTAHGTARPDARVAARGPGRWLTVSEREALVLPPRPRGAPFDVSTRVGKLLLLLALAAAGAAAWQVGRIERWSGVLVGLDAVVLLTLFGTGRLSCMPPDLAVEPARFLFALARRLRRQQGAGELKLAARVRIPHGEMDADELRLLVVPPLPLRGFGGIEVGVCYALGLGARVAMPEVLLRVVAGSPCDEALGNVTRRGRISPGRKPDERVIALSPRLPTVRMTAAIAGALAARVVDREALAAAELAVPAAGPEQTATKPARASLAPAALDARRKPARRRHAA